MAVKKSMDELKRLSTDQFKRAEKIPIVIVLDDVRSMNNVGSVFRTADCFLLEAIYLCGFTPQPPHRDIQKTALGSTETVSWRHFENTQTAIASLKEASYAIYSVEQTHDSIPLNQFCIQPNTSYALIFGNELNGVNESAILQSDGVIEIPQLGSKHSLNISVSAGIVIWALAEQFL